MADEVHVASVPTALFSSQLELVKEGVAASAQSIFCLYVLFFLLSETYEFLPYLLIALAESDKLICHWIALYSVSLSLSSCVFDLDSKFLFGRLFGQD